MNTKPFVYMLDPSYTSMDGPPDRARFPNMENVE